MELTPFVAPMSQAVTSWSTGPAECQAWCSLDAVTPDVVTEWAEAPGVEAWVLVAEGQPIAYGEIWVDDEEGEVELAHLIVAPSRRNSRVGRTLVRSLTTRAKTLHELVVMRVIPGNVAARRCYVAADFARVEPEIERHWNEGQPVEYIWMAHQPTQP